MPAVKALCRRSPGGEKVEPRLSFATPFKTFFFSGHPVGVGVGTGAELSTSSPSQVIHPLVTTSTSTSHLAWKSIIRTGNATEELSRRLQIEYDSAEELWRLLRWCCHPLSVKSPYQLEMALLIPDNGLVLLTYSGVFFLDLKWKKCQKLSKQKQHRSELDHSRALTDDRSRWGWSFKIPDRDKARLLLLLQAWPQSSQSFSTLRHQRQRRRQSWSWCRLC